MSDLIRPELPAGVMPIAVGYPEAAALLGVSERTLRSDAWADCPRLVRGGRTLFVVEAVRAWAISASRPAEKKSAE